MSRKPLFFIALATLLVLSGFVVALEGWATISSGKAAAQDVATQAIEPWRSLTVIGEGKASAKPDQAQINLGVETLASTVQEAIKENDGKMAAVLAALKKLGIADKDIQTAHFSVFLEKVPGSEPLGGADEVIRYRVSNQVRVTVREARLVGNVIDEAVAAGANNIWGVSFAVADPKPLQAEARAAAIADAKAKALELARLSGVTLGRVISVSEVIGPSPVLPVALRAAEGLGGGAPIEPGELEFTWQLQVVYAIEE